MMPKQMSMDLGATEIIFPPLKKKPKHLWYIRAKGGDGWHFLWKTHSNGGGEWAHEFELTTNGGNKKPLRYKTNAGANQYVRRNLNSDAIWEVKEWIDA